MSVSSVYYPCTCSCQSLRAGYWQVTCCYSCACFCGVMGAGGYLCICSGQG